MSIIQGRKICFVISPIGDEESVTRKRSDMVLKHIIRASVEELGYEVIRADTIGEPGIITSQIIQHIVDAQLVVADLTEKNPNVFYELALRHAIRKPLVQLIEKGEIIPFDVAATRIIQFDIKDLDSVHTAKAEILSQVKSLEAGKNESHNPVSVSLDLKMLKESSNAEERSLADIVEAISDLRLSIASVDKRLNTPEVLQTPKQVEDIKNMIETLSFKTSNQSELDSRKRRKKFQPIILEELLHVGIDKNEVDLSFLIIVSLFKEDFPWVYEIGLETFRALKSANSIEDKKKSVRSFERSLEILDHPVFREFYGKSDEMFFMMKEWRHLMHDYLTRVYKFN